MAPILSNFVLIASQVPGLHFLVLPCHHSVQVVKPVLLHSGYLVQPVFLGRGRCLAHTTAHYVSWEHGLPPLVRRPCPIVFFATLAPGLVLSDHRHRLLVCAAILVLGPREAPLKHALSGLFVCLDIQPQIFQLPHQIVFVLILTLVLITPAPHLVQAVLIFLPPLETQETIVYVGLALKVIRSLMIPASTTP